MTAGPSDSAIRNQDQADSSIRYRIRPTCPAEMIQRQCAPGLAWDLPGIGQLHCRRLTYRPSDQRSTSDSESELDLVGWQNWQSPALRARNRLNPHFAHRMAELTVPTPGAELLHRKRGLYLIGKAFDDLGTNLLPSLKNQITHLSNIMERSELLKDKGTKLNSISQIQSELDQTLYQIVSLVAVVRRRTLFSPADTDDRHLKELKGFRAQDIKPLRPYISTQGHADTGDNSSGARDRWGDQTVERPRILLHPGGLGDNVFQIHRLLRLVTDVISSANDSDDVDDNDNDSEIVHPSRPAIRVLQSMIPVIKLSRLFFKKLLRSGMKETPLQSYTEMSSDQINALADSARSILYNLDQIYDALTDPVLADESPEEIPRLINEITSEFNTTMLLVVFILYL
ncbi:hypothetical protein KEM48_014091 [Puccinia striiformis f. sp. tritici PST-130]|nr:hypothetical protein KEM48_014091 [Puccinia striiformis f. sp. tritici PST-130]